MVDDNISDSASKRRSRLTLGTCSASSSRHLPLTANIPHFTHPSSQQSIDKTFKPLPRPQKEKQEPKPKPKPKPKPAATSNKISSIISSLPLRPVSGSPKSLTKKLLQRAEAERKKKDGPLEEAEEGFYDDRGFWVDGSAMEEWKLGTTANDMTGESDSRSWLTVSQMRTSSTPMPTSQPNLKERRKEHKTPRWKITMQQ